MIYDYFEQLPDFFSKSKDTVQYKLMYNYLKYFKYQPFQQRQYKSMMFSILPFFESDLLIELQSLPTGKTLELEQTGVVDLEQFIYNQSQGLYPNLVFKNNTVLSKAVKTFNFNTLPMSLKEYVFNSLKFYQKDSKINVKDKLYIEEDQIEVGDLKTYQFMGNILYYTTSNSFVLLDVINREKIFEITDFYVPLTTDTDFQNQTDLVIVPNGFIIKSNGDYYNYSLLYDYYFLINSVYYTTNYLLTGNVRQLYNLNDYFNIYKGLDRKNIDNQTHFYINVLYNLIMKNSLNRLQELEITLDNNLGYNNKLVIFENLVLSNMI